MNQSSSDRNVSLGAVDRFRSMFVMWNLKLCMHALCAPPRRIVVDQSVRRLGGLTLTKLPSFGVTGSVSGAGALLLGHVAPYAQPYVMRRPGPLAHLEGRTRCPGIV